MKRKLSIKFICRIASMRLLLVFGLLAFGYSMTAQVNPWAEEYESLTDLWKSGKLEELKSKYKPTKGTPTFDNEKDLVVYTNEGAFMSATGCSNVQDFSGSSCGLTGFDSPLNEGNTGACFTPGEILPGIEFNSTGNNGPGGNGLVAVDPGQGFGNPADVVLANFFVDGLVIDFSPAATAVGLNVVTLLGGFNVNVEVYDENGGLIGSSSVGAGSSGGFIGFSSTDPIGQVIIFDPSSGAEGVYSVAFCGGDITCYEGPNCSEYTGDPGFEWDTECEEAVCAFDSFCCDVAWDGVCAGYTTSDFIEECATCLGLDDGCDDCVEPDVVIELGDLPPFCQGVGSLFAKVLNQDDLQESPTFQWSDGLGSSQSAVITENGTYSVMVMAGEECYGEAEITVNVDPVGVLSAYTIVSGSELEMHSSEVVSGGVGVIDVGESTVQDNSSINTWLVGPGVYIDGSSSVANYMNMGLGLELPEFLLNENYNNGMEVINGTVTLTGDDYGHVVVKANATLNIGNAEMNMRSLTLGKGATLNFNQETNLRIKQDLEMAALCEVNIEGPFAVMYVGGTVQIGQGSTVAANIYSIEEMDVNDSGSFMTTYMYGLFISTDGVFSGDNVVWGWNPTCTEGGDGEECVPDDNDGDCFSANGTPGCEYNDCEATVCAIDPFCCDVEWDGICAGEAADFSYTMWWRRWKRWTRRQ